MQTLTDLRVAVIATDGFEESELTQPVRALQGAGAKVDILSLEEKPIQAFKHLDKSIKVDVDQALADAYPQDFDALLLPGGALSADTLRAETVVLDFVRAFEQGNKPIAAICHAPWILVSSGLTPGRVLTSYHTIQDDIRNAGGRWLNREVVVDGNWVTSREPDDIPAFNTKMQELFGSLVRAA